jgi:hypothetical protein
LKIPKQTIKSTIILVTYISQNINIYYVPLENDMRGKMSCAISSLDMFGKNISTISRFIMTKFEVVEFPILCKELCHLDWRGRVLVSNKNPS